MAIDFNTFHNVIDGKLRGADNVAHGINPATGEELWSYPVATKADLEDAVTAATHAFKKWSQTPVEQRKAAMGAFAKALMDHKADMEPVIMKETGKPGWLTTVEAVTGSGILQEHCKYDVPQYKTFEDDDTQITTYYEPLGVCGAICPWNFPVLLAVLKIAPAVLMGNTIIVKPSPYTPYSTLKMVEIAQSCFPPGVVQVLGGDDRLGPWIVEHPGIPKIAFTGSTATGKKVNESAARQLKRVTLELGGNDAAIVFPDVDFEATAKGIAMKALVNTGQYCMATKRLYIHKDIYDQFLPVLSAVVQGLKVGDPNDPSVMVGPVQNKMQFDKVSDLFSDTRATGLDFHLDGHKTNPVASTNGTNGTNGHAATNGTTPAKKHEPLFIPISLLSNAPSSSRIMKEEQFGPLLPTQPWSDLDEVIAAVNDSPYGLASSVWCKDLELAQKTAHRIESGAVQINNAEMAADCYVAGAKHSGLGGEGSHLALVHWGAPKTIRMWKKGFKAPF